MKLTQNSRRWENTQKTNFYLQQWLKLLPFTVKLNKRVILLLTFITTLGQRARNENNSELEQKDGLHHYLFYGCLGYKDFCSSCLTNPFIIFPFSFFFAFFCPRRQHLQISTFCFIKGANKKWNIFVWKEILAVNVEVVRLLFIGLKAKTMKTFERERWHCKLLLSKLSEMLASLWHLCGSKLGSGHMYGGFPQLTFMSV